MIILTENPGATRMIMADGGGCSTRWGQRLPDSWCPYVRDPGWNPWAVVLAVLLGLLLVIGVVLLWRDPPPGEDQTWREWWDSLR